ncbi:MAG: GNAT family N-acetyltransferase [Dermatophilaceae bacterium]
MSSESVVLHARGDRVWVGTVRAQDVAPYRLAVEQSRQRLSRWNPVDPEDLERQLAVQSPDHRTFLIHARGREGDHDIVGKVNVTNVVHGRFESAAVGYDAYDPYAGRGLFTEGLRLVVGLVFAPQDAGGMGLHRIAAAVQPGNVTSAGLLRSLGFQREGYSRRMLWLPGADGSDAWQDHASYAVTREDWPAEPYAMALGRKVVVLVNGPPDSGRGALARQLAEELQIPLFCRGFMKESLTDALWQTLEGSPVGGVVEGWFVPEEVRFVAEGLWRCGMDPAMVTEVWCSSAKAPASARALALGPTFAVDTGQAVGRSEVVRIALHVMAGSERVTSGGPWGTGT